MCAPPVTAEVDDRSVITGCVAGEEEAFRLLEARHGRLIEAVAARVVDERRSGSLEELPGCVDAVMFGLRAGEASTLAAWDESCTLRHYLAVITRQMATSHLQNVTPPATLIASLPTPAALFLDEMLAQEPARQLAEALDRMSPNITALVRLRLRGVDRAGIGAVLGVPAHTVVSNLERVAGRLGELLEGDAEDAIAVWRVLLDAAPTSERVVVAARTEDDEDFRNLRSVVESAWRAVREQAMSRLHPKQESCLSEVTVAAFVDGSLKGADRTRAEGHVAGCARCIDTVATLGLDMRTVDALREAAGLDGRLALAAALVSTTRYRAGEILAELAAAEGDARARELVRLARVGQSLVGGPPPGPPVEPSRVVQTRIPSDEEAPTVAFEALIQDDVHTAARAIDDELAKGTLGTRLRLLSQLAGFDREAGRATARELLERPHPDPGLMEDAEAGTALAEGRDLPREILIERIRDALPDAVRTVLSR